MTAPDLGPVLLLTWSSPPDVGGVERSVVVLTRELTARGCPATLVTHRDGAFPYRRTRIDSVPVVRLSIPSPFTFSAAERLRRAGLDLVNRRFLLALARRRRFAVVHCHHLNVDAVYGRWLARRLDVPFVLTLRGGETEEWIAGRPYRRDFGVETLLAADHVTAVSRFLLDHATALVPGIRGRSSVIRNPVNPTALRDACAPGVTQARGRPYALFVGRLDPVKDVACLVDAYHQALSLRPGLGFDPVVVGDGPLAAKLCARAAAGPGAGRIEFVGSQPHGETLRWIRDARLLVLPSKSSEGCPNVVLEAMALETPVVVSSLPSNTELVVDGVTGALYPVGDSGALAARLVAFDTDPGAGAGTAQRATAYLAGAHSTDRVIGRYLDLYASLARR